MLSPTANAISRPKPTSSPMRTQSCVVNTLEASTDWYQSRSV